jgi:hypothetical protein
MGVEAGRSALPTTAAVVLGWWALAAAPRCITACARPALEAIYYYISVDYVAH